MAGTTAAAVEEEAMEGVAAEAAAAAAERTRTEMWKAKKEKWMRTSTVLHDISALFSF